LALGWTEGAEKEEKKGIARYYEKLGKPGGFRALANLGKVTSEGGLEKGMGGGALTARTMESGVEYAEKTKGQALTPPICSLLVKGGSAVEGKRGVRPRDQGRTGDY